jgi:hypothetical protein
MQQTLRQLVTPMTWSESPPAAQGAASA